MFLHIQLCYPSVVRRVETSKILKNCISNTRVCGLDLNMMVGWLFYFPGPDLDFSWSVWVWAASGAPPPPYHDPLVSVRRLRAAPEGPFSPESRRLNQTAVRHCGERSKPAGWTNSSLENTENRSAKYADDSALYYDAGVGTFCTVLPEFRIKDEKKTFLQNMVVKKNKLFFIINVHDNSNYSNHFKFVSLIGLPLLTPDVEIFGEPIK